MSLMRVALCIIFTLAAADSAPGHLSLVQRTAQLEAQRSQRIAAASDRKETDIMDVTALIKEALNTTNVSADMQLFAAASDREETDIMDVTALIKEALNITNVSAYIKEASIAMGRSVTGGVNLSKPGSQTTNDTAQACSLLAFVPIGSFEQSGNLLKANLEHLHSTLAGYCDVTVLLNHYGGDDVQEYWIQQTDRWWEGWYKRHVQFSTTVPGFKFQVMQELLRQVDMSPFTWVWALDEDFNITQTDVKRALQLTEQSQALISIPAFTQVGSNEEERELSFPMQGPNSDCLYRYADVVEVIFPIFRTKALEVILWDCDHCIGEKTVWGLNRIWCSYTARKLGYDRSTACAIIDGAPMVHENFKTLKGKYDDSSVNESSLMRRMHVDFEQEARAWMAAVANNFPEDYVAGNSKVMNSTKCVRA